MVLDCLWELGLNKRFIVIIFEDYMYKIGNHY